jgi:hypothetical protein
MNPNGEGGGDGGGGQHMVRFLVSSFTALIMSALMIALYWFVPQHEPRLKPNGPSRPPVSNGVWEQNDFMGLVDTQWTLRGGRAEGDALQFYSNGSLFRELTYRAGRLEGTVREYHEKERYRRPPSRGRVAGPAERAFMAGQLRRTMMYRAGRADGPYEVYYADGILKEEGYYHAGRKRAEAKYGKDGRAKGRAAAPAAKENAWTLGR